MNMEVIEREQNGLEKGLSSSEFKIYILKEPYERRENIQKQGKEDTGEGLEKDLNDDLSYSGGVQLPPL